MYNFRNTAAGTLVWWCKRSLRNSDGIIQNWGAKCR